MTLSDIDIDIDSSTGQTYLTVGGEIVVDVLGGKHTGIITDIGPGPDPLFSVLLTCRNMVQEVTVTESQILARVTPMWDD